MVGKANSQEDKGAAYTALFAAEGGLAKQLNCLEALIPEGSVHFCQSRRIPGGVAIACILDIMVALQADGTSFTI